MEATLALMAAGRIRVEPLITHLVSYRAAPEVWRLIRGKGATVLGATFTWED